MVSRIRNEDKKRILIFAHDGRGLGHLRRLARIASELVGEASVLFVTGHRWVASFLPPQCEFVHVPSLDSISSGRSRHWGVEPFVNPQTGIGIRLRREILRQCVDIFQPDAFVVDYLPMGVDHELLDILNDNSSPRKNYLILRGVLGQPTQVWADVLTPQARSVLKQCYEKILVTCDSRIVDVGAEYRLGPDITCRLEYTGYVVPKNDEVRVSWAREARRIPAGKRWVVCAAGGGKDGEDLIEHCWDLALQYPECYFDIVAGPRSGLAIRSESCKDDRIRVYQDDFHLMPEKLAAADSVIIRGGYNSLLEASVGTANMIVWPYDAEQTIHAERLSAFRRMQVVRSVEELETAFADFLSLDKAEMSLTLLDVDGAKKTAASVLDDLQRNELACMLDRNFTGIGRRHG
jgi:predicted glycosyltransferase